MMLIMSFLERQWGADWAGLYARGMVKILFFALNIQCTSQLVSEGEGEKGHSGII